MVNFEVGQRVEADISGTTPMLGTGCSTYGTIKGHGRAAGTFIVQTDAPFNGVNAFQLEASRLTALPD